MGFLLGFIEAPGTSTACLGEDGTRESHKTARGKATRRYAEKPRRWHARKAAMMAREKSRKDGTREKLQRWHARKAAMMAREKAIAAKKQAKRGSLAIEKPEELYSFSHRVLTRQNSVFRTEMDKRKTEMRH